MQNKPSGLSDRLKAYPLYVLPHHFISRIVFKLTRIKSDLKNPVIRWFIKTFNVDMQDSIEQDITRFENFNAFFTRALKDGARTIDKAQHSICSPVDGAVSQSGPIKNGRIFQAKGHHYSLNELLGNNSELCTPFENGQFVTIYLSPRDYHRIHMPVAATLRAQVHVPGRLFSVAPHTVNTVPRIFARNERVATFYDTEFGPCAMVLVGAINVAAIETVWHGLITPPAGKQMSEILYNNEQSKSLEKGAEMGRFNMGSTVILLFGEQINWNDDLKNGKTLRMGEKIGAA